MEPTSLNAGIGRVSGATSTMRANEPMGEIPSEVHSYEMLVGELSEQLVALNAQLVPVLGLQAPKGNPELKEPSRQSPIANGIARSNTKLAEAIQFVRCMRDDIRL